ncbi:DUF4949 domain-containing protein [Legionella londiniensis]|uniref:Hemin binding protein n=1 Tax=Legionella londiniensis TaxID=45068 RepID=A0A0W0VHG7_9GAMM|nr:DUF4949 domain-containing protein [Legionella londiniensis]KTD19567.1 hemin binding protein [Legionella londiniensis]STX92210.1 hemin binding protein Hbp [Legionella londiniensis]
MKLNGKFSALFGGLTLFYSSLAAAQGPAVCPSASAIKAEGVSYAFNLMLDLYLALEGSNYDTDHNWEFAVGIIQAEDEEDALSQGNELVSTLSGQPTPEEIEPGTWACIYNLADDNYLAAAFYSDFPISPAKMKSYYLNKKR